MKLVVTYSTSDGCTYSFEHTVAIEYPSLEQFKADFEQWAMNDKLGTFFRFDDGFLGAGLSKDVCFGTNYCSKYDVRTLEDWFEEARTVIPSAAV